MRPYAQHCAAARALDVIGDRWSLLIVRELLLRDCRFSELADGLPGIASNLLTDRLRALEEHGVLERDAGGEETARAVYRLTERGRDLAPVLRSLSLWGMPLMPIDPGTDAQRGRWLAFALDAALHDADTSELPAMRVSFVILDEHVLLTAEPGAPVQIALGGAPGPDATATVTGEPTDMLKLLLGRDTEVEIEGDVAALAQLLAQKPL